jgi:transposase
MTIYINKDALKFINNEVQISRNIETGGILLGAILRTEDILITHAYTEGVNNKIKVLKRNAFGLRNFNRLRARILYMMA